MGKRVNSLIQKIREAFISYLKSEAVKSAFESLIKNLIRKVITKATFGGISGWIVEIVAKELVEEGVIPMAQLIFRKIGYTINVIDGAIVIKRLKKAIEDRDENEYDSANDDIFNRL